MSWNRYSILVARGGEVPRVWRSRDGTAAWLRTQASRRASTLAAKYTYDYVEVVPAAEEDVADWQKTEIANRTSLHNRIYPAAAE